jgi:hypothetical protein
VKPPKISKTSPFTKLYQSQRFKIPRGMMIAGLDEDGKFGIWEIDTKKPKKK